MINAEALKSIEYHEDRIALIQKRLYKEQKALIEAYKSEWAEINNLIKTGHWDEKAVFKGNAYGLKIDDDSYVFQIDAALPFLPNVYYRDFEQSYEEYYAIKLFISLQLRDVIEQIGDGPMKRPAALLIKHYYHNVRVFDLDNKAKQVIINTLKTRLIKDDNINRLPYNSEEALWNDLWNEHGNRTMLYLIPYDDRTLIETKITQQYPRIDNINEVLEGKIPLKSIKFCSSKENI